MKKLIIIASFVLIILIIITIIISNLLKKQVVVNQEKIVPIPTIDYNLRNQTKPDNVSKKTQDKNLEKQKSYISKSKLLSKDDSQKLEQLKKILPYYSQDFDIVYSPLLNKFIISKKTPQADEKIKKWAAENNYSILIDNKELIIETNKPVQDYKKEIEDVYQKNRIPSPTSITPSPSSINPTQIEDHVKTAIEKENEKAFKEFQDEYDKKLKPFVDFLRFFLNSNYNPQTDQNNLPTKNPNTFNPQLPGSSSSLSDIFNEVGVKVGVPPKILEAVMTIEYPSTFSLSSSEIAQYSAPGNVIPGCGPNLCSAAGPMQMTIGIDDQGDTSCPQCGAGFCPNAWAAYGNAANIFGQYAYTPQPCNIKDNVYASAYKLKSDSGATDPNNWTQDQVYKAAESYYGSCSEKYRYERLGNRTYCEFLWWYYQNNQSNDNVSQSNNQLISSGSHFKFYCQGNTAWQNKCYLGSSGCGPSSLAMILNSFGVNMNPPQVDSIFQQNGWRSCDDVGSYMTSAINSNWLTNQGFTIGQDLVSNQKLSLSDAKRYIDNGFLIIASSTQYPCANCRSSSRIDHVFVVDNVDAGSGTVSIRDPNNCSYTDGDDEIVSNIIKNTSEFPWYYAFPIKKMGANL